MTKLLLVDLDKDYIRRVENDSDFKLKHDLFQEAVSNLQQDINYWTESSGIDLGLETVNEVEVEKVHQATLTKTYTRVYAKMDSDNDLAWINLSLGNLKPSTSLIRTELRGWQFEWKK
jgi:hypothetical protein